MRIATLFDGAGLARLGLERAGHVCEGIELDPAKHHLSQFVGSGNCILGDATQVDLSLFDAVWLSPPCQQRSSARTQGDAVSAYAGDYLEWALALVDTYPDKVVWVENVLPQGVMPTWGTPYNAAQFQPRPVQNRTRLVGGRYRKPVLYREFQHQYGWLTLCPAITATEYKGCKTDARRASRFYGRKLTLEECAYHQGFTVPQAWYEPMEGYTPAAWMHNLYEAIGNGVPTFMAEAFGNVYSHPGQGEMSLWEGIA
jgi:site-specific DNA-cytosine methylase